MVTNYQRVDSLQVKNLFPYEIETMEIMQRLVFHCYPRCFGLHQRKALQITDCEDWIHSQLSQ